MCQSIAKCEDRPQSLRGKKLELAVEDAKPDFGGRLRFRGRILEKAETMKS